MRGSSHFTLRNCEVLVEDSVFNLTPEQVLRVFALSKQTVSNETDDKQVKQYSRMNEVEFIEFIARMTLIVFQDSELSDISLEEKLEYVLRNLLPQVE